MSYLNQGSWTYLRLITMVWCAIILLACFIAGCSSNNSDTVQPVVSPDGVVVSYSGCKQSDAARPFDDASLTPGSTCLSYQYNGTTRLELTHFDLLANCCITGLKAHITCDGNNIIITESEVLDGSGCHCICAYDMNLLITDIPPGTYKITVNEFYQFEGYQKLEFTVTLSGQTANSFCVDRPQY